ncbi:MAG: YihY/virulence factor BrkB family protein [Alphaproteobacteria bacterium]
MSDPAPHIKALEITKQIIRPFTQAIAGFLEDNGLVMAGHLAFIGLLSMFPFLIFLVSLAGFVGQTDAGQTATALAFDSMPELVRSVLEPPIQEVISRTRGDLMTLSALFAIWTSATGFEAVRTVLNQAFNAQEHRPIWRRRGMSALYVIGFAGFIVLGVMLLVVGPLVFRAARDLLDVPEFWAFIWAALRYGLTSIVFLFVISMLYRLLPAKKLAWRYIIPGAFLAQILWLASASGFSFYLKYAEDYAVTYGSLGGIIIALLFFYVMGAIFIMGAEFSAALAHIYDKRHGQDDHPN